MAQNTPIGNTVGILKYNMKSRVTRLMAPTAKKNKTTSSHSLPKTVRKLVQENIVQASVFEDSSDKLTVDNSIGEDFNNFGLDTDHELADFKVDLENEDSQDDSGEKIRGEKKENKTGIVDEEKNIVSKFLCQVQALSNSSPELFQQILCQAFGEKAKGLAGKVLDLLNSGTFPKIQFLNSEQLNGNNGAYFSEGKGTIYINNGLSSTQRYNAFIEEMGHHIDRLLGVDDTQGDEGAIWLKALTLGRPLNAQELKELSLEDDQGTIQIKGKKVLVEFQEKNSEEALKNILKLLEQPQRPALQKIFNQSQTIKSEKSFIKLLKTSKPEQILNFIKAFNTLSPEEQKITLQILDILAKSTAPKDYRQKILTLLKLAKKGAEKIGKTLNQLGVFIPVINFNAPTAEDASSRLQFVHMAYDPKDVTLHVQKDYILDVLNVAQEKNFKLVLQTGQGSNATQIKKNTIKDLQKTKNLTLTLAQTLVDQHVVIHRSSQSGYRWGEDYQQATSGDDHVTPVRLRRIPKVSAKVFEHLIQFTTARKKLDADEGHHTFGLPFNDPQNLVDENAIQGLQQTRDASKKAAALAQTLQRDVKEMKTYNEGGNMLDKLGVSPSGVHGAVLDGVSFAWK